MRNLWYLFLAAIAFHVVAGVTLADSREAGRLAMGLKLFRATLAADLAIADRVSSDVKLHLLVFTNGNREQAQRLADKLIAGGSIRNTPVRVTVTDGPNLALYNDQPPAGLFIADASLSDSTLKMLNHVRGGKTTHLVLLDFGQIFVFLREINRLGETPWFFVTY